MPDFDLPDLKAIFQESFGPVMAFIDGLKSELRGIIASCPDPVERKNFEDMLEVLSYQQGEVAREVPALVDESIAGIAAGMESIRKSHGQIVELEEKIRQVDLQAQERPARPRELAGARELGKARAKLAAIRGGVPASGPAPAVPLSEGVELRRRLLEIVKPPSLPPRERKLHNIWENWNTQDVGAEGGD